MNETAALAYCIGQWASALAHLNALVAVGEQVPYAVLGRVTRELDGLCLRWSTLMGDAFYEDRDKSVREARAYCTEHPSEIEALTNREES